MTERAEAVLLGAAALLAGIGTALVTVANDEGITLDAAINAAVVLAALGGIQFAVRRWAPKSTRLLLPPVALLTALGLIEVFRIDRDLGRLQRLWLLLGAAIAMATLALLHQRGVQVLRRFRYLFLAASFVLLVLPLLPSNFLLGGATVNGSRLWVQFDLGNRTFSFQPGEVAKVLLVVFFASYLAERRRGLTEMPRSVGPIGLPEPRQLLPILFAFGISFAVLIYQRDLGASILLFSLFIVLLYAATDRFAYLIAGGLFITVGASAAQRAFSHVQVRVDAWLHPFDDFAGSGFQVAQGVFALGEGGLLGVGLGEGAPYLIPAVATDYIFVALVEEIGLAGGFAILSAFGILFAVGFGIAIRSGDSFRSLLAFGLTAALAIQTVLILAGVLRLLPLTGITLPFVSYGGSSLLANLSIVALLARISHEERT